ncbi:MAG: helix-turn-helix transcriptional regulator [Candidatus Binatus sp.]|uniref:helix-turn-helix domain-containing protein n=1 Tax=Candidatus Binatus sp. TaxID=2811406 RepID=UPI003BB1AAD9
MSKVKSSPRTTAARAAKAKPDTSPVRPKTPNFGEVIRTRRRELNLTQDEIAARIKISTPYIGHLESGKRHPSDKILTKLGEVLGLDNRELFFLANPHAQALISEPVSAEGSSWEQFQKNEKLQRIHNVTPDEMQILSQVALMGDIQSPRDLIYILTTIRHAVGR